MRKKSSSNVGVRRRLSRQNSVSMQDWMERKVSIQDVSKLVGVNETKEDAQLKSKLETRLNVYNGPNPFIPVLPTYTKCEKIKIAFFVCSGILLIKFVLILIVLLLLWVFSLGITLGAPDTRKERKPMSCWRKPFLWGIMGLVRVLLFIGGFYWIGYNYKNSNYCKYKYAKVLTPNHVALWDGFIVFWLTGCIGVAKKELYYTPIFGRVLDAVGTIWVDRKTKEGRKLALKQMNEQVSNPNNQPLLVFPQGTCSNTMTITQFKAGAFISGKPVTPIAIHYTNCFSDIALLAKDMYSDGIRNLCQFINFARVDILPVYEPNDEEKKDANLFADNVRTEIAGALGATMTPHTFDDVILRYFADELENTPLPNMIVMDSVYHKLHMKTKTVMALGKIYLKHCDNDGRINYQRFHEIFHLSNSEYSKLIFKLLCHTNPQTEQSKTADNVDNEYILFDDFLIGIAICYQMDFIDDAIVLFFRSCDTNNDGKISKKDIHQAIKFVEQFNYYNNEVKFPLNDKIEKFSNEVFNTLDDYNINHIKFKENVHLNGNFAYEFIQGFLQYIIFIQIGIELDKDMVVKVP